MKSLPIPTPVTHRAPLRRIALALCLPLCLLALAPSAHAQSEDEFRGGLRVVTEGGEAIDMPLTGLSVDAQVIGSIARVSVEQTYENPFDARIEAVYVFPLPEDAAVNEMVMVIGQRRIRADLQEREEARRTYERARERGQTASLLEQERPNIFTQSVANIEPGHPIHVLITYVEQLPYKDGHYHFAFPMVVGPRYIAGAPIAHAGTGRLPDTTVVSDASRITPPMLPEGVAAPYEVDFQLDLDAGMPLHEVVSTSHNIELEWVSDSRVHITLPPDERAPDQDVVIDYAVTDDEPQVGLLTHYDERGGFFSLMLEPPSAVDAVDVRPKEMVFVIDMSGSMSGYPLETAKETIRHALRNMNPDDSFQIVRFSDSASAMAEHPLANTPANVSRGVAYVDALSGMGGTNMEGGIRAALMPAPDPERMRIVFFLTDGYIGSESRVLDLIDEHIGEARLFSLGVGSAPNRFLLDKMAEVGRGDVLYVNYNEDVTQVVEQFYGRIRNPILTDIEVDWGGLEVADVSPNPIPDVFSSTPIMLTGRYLRPGVGTVVVSGLQGSRPVEFLLDVELGDDESADRVEIPFIWARRRVDQIGRRSSYDPSGEDRQEIIDLSLEYRFMTQFTSFVAVEERISADVNDPLHTLAVAVPLPEGMTDDEVGFQIDPSYVQPGDPELTVYAPEDTLAVTAYFPFGLVQNLQPDPQTGQWRSRFLVPRDVPDGIYTILIAIERTGGLLSYEEVPFTIDSSAPEIQLTLVQGATYGFGDLLTAEVRIPQPEPTCGPEEAVETCAEVLPEQIKFVRIYLPDGRSPVMQPSETEENLWVFHYRIRESIGIGPHEVLIEAVDVAGNTSFATADFVVVESVAAR